RSEVNINSLTIGRRSGSSRTAKGVNLFDLLCRDGLLPEQLAVRPPHGYDHQLVVFHSGQKDMPIPHNRRRVTGRQLSFPKQFTRGPELNRWLVFFGDAGTIGAAETSPPGG